MSAYKLYNGDSLEVLRTLPAASVDLVLADPPYSSGGAFRDDRAKKTTDKYQNTETVKEYPEFMGDSRDQFAYYYWTALWVGQALRVLKPGRVMCVFTDWRQLATTINAVQVGGLVLRGVVPWNKTEAARPAKGRFRSQCEYVVWGSAGPMEEQVETCLPGFFTYTVRPTDKKHVTAKPVSLMLDMLSIAAPGSVVLDPFMGSGTTGKACAVAGCKFIGIEKDPTYFEVAEAEIFEAYLQRPLLMAEVRKDSGTLSQSAML